MRLNLIKHNMPAAIMFVLGFVFMILGIFRGEVGTVLRKAANICLECIGIG